MLPSRAMHSLVVLVACAMTAAANFPVRQTSPPKHTCRHLTHFPPDQSLAAPKSPAAGPCSRATAVRWVWVKGHSQVDGNEAADAGATSGKAGKQMAIKAQEVLNAHDQWRKNNELALATAQERLRVVQEAGDPFEINDAAHQAAQVEQQRSTRAINAQTAAQTTAAAAKDSMVRCKNIDKRIKQFVKQANKNADPAEVVKMDPTRATNAEPDDKVQQPGSASEEDNDQGEDQSDKCEGCEAPVKFCVCQMTAGTTSDKNGRKTKKTGHRRRYKSKTKRKTQNTPPP
eukprot:COSAG06_NODE_2745_length_6354_cov_59.692246_6_plen_287_part_00